MSERIAVVTGANRGIGLHLVEQLHRRGWQVVAACRRPGAADALAALHPQAIIELDTSDSESIRRFGADIAARAGRIDLLINNAGVMMPSARPVDALPDDNGAANGPLAALEAEAMLEVIRVNSIGPLLVAQSVEALLGKGSVVLNISSRLGSIGVGTADEYAYAMSKAALNMATTILARELAPTGVIVVAASPGWVLTDMGGGAAMLTADQSTSALVELVDRLGPGDSGTFVGHTGEPIPW